MAPGRRSGKWSLSDRRREEVVGVSKVSLLPLHVQRELHGFAVVVRAVGEVDRYTVPALRTELAIAVAMANPPFPVVVDLTLVDFCGAAGLNELVTQNERAGAAGTPLRIIGSHPAVVRSIVATGLDEVLHLYPDLAGALALDEQAGRFSR
jgi:anti-sigma B factor antagonist